MSAGRGARRSPSAIASRYPSTIGPSELSTHRVAAEFKRLIADGAKLLPQGTAKRAPASLLRRGYTPKHRLDAFGVRFYLTNTREDQNFRFFVAYVVMPHADGEPVKAIHPRIFYKDSSLVWRSPSHCIRSEEENWIGKGDLKVTVIDGEEIEYSAEETTNLPLEMQCALDVLSRRGGKVRRDVRAVPMVLRNAPDDRFEPYADFSGPRRRAMADPRNRINGGDLVADFERENDPTSLRFVPGYEPDFSRGLTEMSHSKSRIYGGDIWKYRIVSKNRTIQYQFIAGPRQVWIIPPQTLTTELSSYGVRTVDVNVHEDLCVPGYEYHFMDESVDPPRLLSQIPEGYAGALSDVDPSRADASPWLEKLPVIREFRRHFCPR